MNGNNISLRQDHDDNVTKTFHLKLDYQRTFGDHRVGAFVAYEQRSTKARTSTAGVDTI